MASLPLDAKRLHNKGVLGAGNNFAYLVKRLDIEHRGGSYYYSYLHAIVVPARDLPEGAVIYAEDDNKESCVSFCLRDGAAGSGSLSVPKKTSYEQIHAAACTICRFLASSATDGMEANNVLSPHRVYAHRANRVSMPAASVRFTH